MTRSELVAVMFQIEPGAWRGALVGIRELRRACGLADPDFTATVMAAARSGVISLHQHDFPASLSASERAELIEVDGACYVGAAYRGRVP